MNKELETCVSQVVAELSQCQSMLFITGAGISADSGIPTYRGIGGLYESDGTEDGVPIEVALSGPMLEKNPALTWKYLLQIADAVRGAKPNRGHEMIAQFEQKMERVWTLTQNIDGFHLKAGSQNVIEIHGNMRNVRCVACNHHLEVIEEYFDQIDRNQLPPRCVKCDSPIRPDVVLFEEMLPAKAQQELMTQAQIGFDIVFCVGTSGLFPYIAAPVEIARDMGIPTVEINLVETVVSKYCKYRMECSASVALEQIWNLLS